MADQVGVLDKVEAELAKLWGQRESLRNAAAQEREQAAEAERLKAEAMKPLPGLLEQEAKAWERYESALDDLAAAIEDIGALRAPIAAAFGTPGPRVHKALRTAVKAEIGRRLVRERAAAGHDREANKRARAAELRHFLREQKRRKRSVIGDEGQSIQRVDETEAAIRRLEGKDDKPRHPELSADDMISENLRQQVMARRSGMTRPPAKQ